MTRLRFTPGGHRYYLTPPDGGKAVLVPSATGLLELLAKPALVGWAARIAADYAINEWDTLSALPMSERHAAIAGSAKAARNRAAVKGTEVHRLAEQLLHGHPVDAAPDVLPKVEAAARFIEASGLKVQLTEARVFSDCDDDFNLCGYAGTFDVLAEHPRYGRILVDWKTGSGPWPEMALQLAAYAHAEHIVVGDEDHPMWHVDCAAVAMVTPDGVDLHMLDGAQLATAAQQFGLLRQMKHLPAAEFQQVSA